MLGAVLILVALLVVLPVTFFAIGTILSILLGHFLRTEGEHVNAGSELIDLNV